MRFMTIIILDTYFWYLWYFFFFVWFYSKRKQDIFYIFKPTIRESIYCWLLLPGIVTKAFSFFLFFFFFNLPKSTYPETLSKKGKGKFWKNFHHRWGGPRACLFVGSPHNKFWHLAGGNCFGEYWSNHWIQWRMKILPLHRTVGIWLQYSNTKLSFWKLGHWRYIKIKQKKSNFKYENLIQILFQIPNIYRHGLHIIAIPGRGGTADRGSAWTPIESAVSLCIPGLKKFSFLILTKTTFNFTGGGDFFLPKFTPKKFYCWFFCRTPPPPLPSEIKRSFDYEKKICYGEAQFLLINTFFQRNLTSCLHKPCL